MAKKYAIPSLLAAGLVPTIAHSGEPATISTERSAIDEIMSHVLSVSDANEFSLAGHQSHQSHGSHQSHQSHRSYSHAPPPPSEEGSIDGESVAERATSLAGNRNIRSTPHKGVLPERSQVSKKPRILKGNSQRFFEYVTRVQLALTAKGYDVGSLDGKLHAKTIAAIYQFQKDAGIIPTGKLENETLNRLNIVVL